MMIVKLSLTAALCPPPRSLAAAPNANGRDADMDKRPLARDPNKRRNVTKALKMPYFNNRPRQQDGMGLQYNMLNEDIPGGVRDGGNVRYFTTGSTRCKQAAPPRESIPEE